MAKCLRGSEEVPTFERLNRKVVTARISEIVAQKLCTPRTKTRVRLV